jgi:hypothetical protein
MVQLSRPRWRIAAIAASLLTGLATVPTVPAAAHGGHPGQSTPTVIASGLNNPRHARWANGALYVAEAGVGGTGACIPSPEGGDACYGRSGSITRVKAGHQKRVVRGLPSVAVAGGESAIGPADVRVQGQRYAVALGLGADPAKRKLLPGAGRKLGTISAGRLGRSGLTVVADVAAFEATANPDGKQVDSNPVALLSRGRKNVIVDAGGNSLLTQRRHGRLHTAAIFPTVDVLAPAFLGLPPGAKIPMDAVPTAAAYGPDGAIYVSQLTGFPFPVGAASIWRVVPGHTPTAYATGLTNVTDLAFGRDGSLYAVQIADQGLLAGPTATGSVVRIPAGGGAHHRTVVDGLATPYGIALHHGAAYVTTCSVCPGGGEVLKVPLHPAP